MAVVCAFVGTLMLLALLLAPCCLFAAFFNSELLLSSYLLEVVAEILKFS
jgi:hypothetical protein